MVPGGGAARDCCFCPICRCIEFICAHARACHRNMAAGLVGWSVETIRIWRRERAGAGGGGVYLEGLDLLLLLEAEALAGLLALHLDVLQLPLRRRRLPLRLLCTHHARTHVHW